MCQFKWTKLQTFNQILVYSSIQLHLQRKENGEIPVYSLSTLLKNMYYAHFSSKFH